MIKIQPQPQSTIWGTLKLKWFLSVSGLGHDDLAFIISRIFVVQPGNRYDMISGDKILLRYLTDKGAQAMALSAMEASGSYIKEDLGVSLQ